MPTYPLQITCLAVISCTPVLAAIFVGLRIYTRRKLHIRLSWDDYLIIASLLLSISLIGPSWRHVKMWHVGIHIYDVPPNEIEPNYDHYYAVQLAFNLLNIPILPLVKASIIMLLLRAGSVLPWLRNTLFAIMFFDIGAALVPWFLYIFICPPQTGNTWKPRTFGNVHCMGKHRYGEMLIWVTCANLVTDLLIFPIPFLIVRRMMSARIRSRLVVIAVFMSSLAVTAMSAAKIYLSYRDRLFSLYKADWTYPIDFSINHVENNVAIMVANVPILRGLVTRWVFNFKTKATPDRIVRAEHNRHNNPDWQWSSSTNSSALSRVARKNRFVQKIMPCMEEPFGSSMHSHGPDFPPRIVTTDYRGFQKRAQQKTISSYTDTYVDPKDTTHIEDIEKMGFEPLETVRSIGSLGSSPTLVESPKDLELQFGEVSPSMSPRRFSTISSPIEPLSPRRISSVDYGSPISPLERCLLREEDEIYPFPYRS